MLGAVMRILGGEHKGRRLKAPAGRGTRPMLAVARESIFQIAAPWLDGARVLDLFSGAGSLGLEACSRGAAEVRCFETGRAAREALEANVALLGAGDRVSVRAVDALEPLNWGDGPFDLVLIDPPFPVVRDPAGRARVMAALEALAAGPLEQEGLIVLHLPRALEVDGELPGALGRTSREHGEQRLVYLQRR
jgi:16S rRNA (guanine966-N2)-methyltransferase